MKSGDHSITRENDLFRGDFAEIADADFQPRTFSVQPALVAKEPVNGHRVWHNYHGGSYDSSKFDLVTGAWDHEHCSVCFFTIKEGYTYWQNGVGVTLLCDACHNAFHTQRSNIALQQTGTGVLLVEVSPALDSASA